MLIMAAVVIGLSTSFDVNGQSKIEKVGRLLKSSGYEANSFGDGVWMIKRPTTGPVLVAVQDDILVIGMVIAEKANFQVTAASAGDMLKLAHKLDYMKIGIDDDGDLFLRAELKVGSLVQDDLNDILVRVIRDSDKVREAIKPYRTPK